MTFDGLVPENFEEFRSVKFWDGFFQKRNRKAFEWYGEWKQLQPLVWGACARPNKQILMLGCGNSDLSAQMYDAGCRSIVNIDFSKICIKEMMIKNLRQRPQMKWIVMDMTQMTVGYMLSSTLLSACKWREVHSAVLLWCMQIRSLMPDSQLMHSGLCVVQQSSANMQTHLGLVSCMQACQHAFWLQFKDESFHIAVDKGALDALMGEDTDAAGIAGGKLLSEVQRVLASCDGQYLCVTLGQTHVLTTLLSTFGLGWGIAIDRIPPSPDMAKSPLQPLLVTVMRIPQPTSKQETRERQHEQQQNEVDGQIDDDYTEDGQCSDVVQDKQACTAVPLVQLSFGAEAGVVNSEQLADVIKVVEQENRLRASGGRTQPDKPSLPDVKPAVAQFDQLKPGRRCVVPLPQPAARVSGRGMSSDGNTEGNHSARFTAVVLDVDAAAAKRAVRDCAVFIVPQGREHEWLFSSPEGQGQVAQGCSAKRVVLVSLNRGHTFGSMKAVQGELSPLVMDLAPIASRQLEAAIPFMTTQEGIGSRTVLEEAESALTGRISIEDITVQNDGAADTVLRRMVFTSNRNLVQSEAVLRSSMQNSQTTEATPATEASERSTDAAVPGSSTNGKPGKAKGKATKQKANAGSEGQSAATQGTQTLSVDHSHLACDYHKGIIAGLSLIQPHLITLAQTAQQDSQQTSQQSSGQQHQQDQQSAEHQDVLGQSHGGPSSRPQAMVVGLGGGGLPVFLNKHCGMDVQSVELDPVVVDLARRHFGFADSASLQATVGDGFEAVAQLAQSLSSGCSADSGSMSNDISTPAHLPEQQEQTGHSADSKPDQSSHGVTSWSSQQLDVLIVDAGSGDASVAMSCPPAAFLEPLFLQHARQVLKAGGMLVVNCVSRVVEPYKAAVKALQRVFAEVYELDVDEDVNKVLFALLQPLQDKPGTHQSKSNGRTHKKGKSVSLRAQASGLYQTSFPVDGSASA
ncbi:MAG: hypothetical protein FRX49_00321, partial [Trebouxia sp. A1-2]